MSSRPGRARLAAMRGAAARFSALPRPRRWAVLASAVWAVIVAGYGIGFLSVAAGGQGRGTLFLDAMFFLVALGVPLVLVWLAAWLAEELVRQRALTAALAEAASPLVAALDATRERLDRHGPASPEAIQRAVQGALLGQRGPDLSPQLERVLGGLNRIEAALDRSTVLGPLAANRTLAPPLAAELKQAAAAAPPPAPPDEPVPPLPEPDPDGRPDWADLMRALDFPRDPEDREGFRALKVALRYPPLAQVLQAAEDILNLLAQEQIYVDDLPMAEVDVEAWRRFIDGKRGAEVAAIAAIDDAGALEAARRLMQTDSVFRDSAQFFQRRFDRVLAELGPDATEEQIRGLAATRSGRAFVLLARLNGSLD